MSKTLLRFHPYGRCPSPRQGWHWLSAAGLEPPPLGLYAFLLLQAPTSGTPLDPPAPIHHGSVYIPEVKNLGVVSRCAQCVKHRLTNALCRFNNALFAYLVPFCIVLAMSSVATSESTFFRWMFIALIGTFYTQGINTCSRIVSKQLHRKYQYEITPCRFVKRRRIRAVT